MCSARGSVLPRNLVWEVTGRCNLCCRHCYNVWTAPGAPPVHDLDTDGALDLLGEIQSARLGLDTLTLTGGEPLLRPDLDRLVATARRRAPRAQITVATNGLRLTLARARALAGAGADVVQLTLLAPEARLHDELVGRAGAFDGVLRAIDAVRRASLTGVVFFVAMRTNIETFVGTARLAHALGAASVTFNRFQPGGRGLECWHELTPSFVQLATTLRQLPELRREVPVSLGTIVPRSEAGGTDTLERCPIGTRNAYPTIGPGGVLRPCNHLPREMGRVGSQPLRTLLSRVGRISLPVGPSGGCPAVHQLVGSSAYGIRDVPRRKVGLWADTVADCERGEPKTRSV